MLEEYGRNKTEGLKNVLDFMEVPQDKRQAKRDETGEIHNQAKQAKPVLQKAKDLLDDFYRPFNRELVKLLGDNKWMFKKN